ncbi:hypothetical protein L208DRAFT_1429666 [Tricholoma matsutake]|nr:hypothetical protein L208DRAFT_1429666 [Tricholoma matsutake 945]
MPTGKAHRSSPTTNDDVDQLEQDGDSDDTPLSSLPETSKILPSTKVLTSSGNLRKRRQDGEFSPPPSPKKLKPPTATRACPTSNSSSTARRALPLCVTDSLSCSSPARRSTKSASIPASPPPNEVIPLPASSPSKMRLTYNPTELPQEIPPHLHSCLDVQKRAILRALHHNAPKALYGNEYEESEDEAATNEIAFQQLMNVLTGTVNRGEGNSCLILGPRGSGKTSLVEQCISNLSAKPVVLRLSGWTQFSDRLAMREIAYQLGQQTGNCFLSQKNDVPEQEPDDDEERNPFLEVSHNSTSTLFNVSLPPASQLPGLISLLPTLSQSTIVILDGFDLFALHPRQSLLYCLLDTVQSYRASAQSKGLAVIGITSRMDTLNILEKRVKSRFSGRMIRTAPPRKLRDWLKFVKTILRADIQNVVKGPTDQDVIDEWHSLWEVTVQNFLTDKVALDILSETFSITHDIRMLSRLLTSLAVHLSPVSPFLMVSQFASTAALQRSRPRFPFLHTLSYPSLCLLIASVHADTAGRSIFTFEMLHENFCDQVRASMSAPVQVNGGSIGMVRCTREAFEHLINAQIFLSVTPISTSTRKEFLKYRCIVDRTEVKKAVETIGQINLKKWLTKAQ